MRQKLLLFAYLLAAFILIFSGWKNWQNNSVKPPPDISRNPSSIPLPPDAQTVRVERVVDGDTIVVAGNRKIRYIGIDTPETVDPRRSVGCFGRESTEKNRLLTEGKYVKLVKDVSDTDKYGRLLRYVWAYDTQEATGGAVFVNEFLVREGYARASTYPPDVRYADYFVKLQEEARLQNKGMWQSCSF